MTIYKSSHYYSNAVPEAPPLPAIRTRGADWDALDEEGQFHVNLCLSGLMLLGDLPLDARTFIRRHHPATLES